MHSWHSSKPSSSPSKSAKKSLCACWAGLAQELLTWSSQQLRSSCLLLLGVGPASCPSLTSVVSISPISCVIRSCVSGTQQQACPFSGQGDVASQPHLTGEERGRPALWPDHPGKQKKELFRFIPPHPRVFMQKSTVDYPFKQKWQFLVWQLGLTNWNSSLPNAGLAPGRWQSPGWTREAVQQGSSSHTPEKEEQHPLVGNARHPPERNVLHPGNQATGGESQRYVMDSTGELGGGGGGNG